ncbi:hypothetical protein FB567DRAFT_124050 [Paraphoma chrysanthemicola]|uniref:Uncharacterized protein n=1 Tax=Paraphoma chrysanthemicola TaxID=798071 RepID=A0A8K0VVX8_9PLEO|nr:hypothetical protein FB567DRAFT_124050 [Paraphoma chrysanthemicola]
MYGRTATTDSNSTNNVRPGDPKRKDTFLSRCTEIYENKYWKPHALRAPVLIITIAICWALIAVLEYLLSKSQRDSGLMFAPVINDLPLSDTFLYLYFPTIVAVIFSIYWAWIDLETKRMEPYYQLSKENGALGKDSLLLHYPFSFIPLVPLKAFRDRHWPVFWASFAVVLVTWGLVPTQAGIFSVETVTRATNLTFAVSTATMPFDQQATSLTFRYAQSTYGIVSLNETLPQYMARNYTLTPFEPSGPHANISGKGTYSAQTTMYTLDLECEDASHKADNSTSIVYSSNNGCNFTLGLTGNLTVGDSSAKSEILAIRQYTGMYVGYHSGGFADYYLSDSCPESGNTTFYAAFAKSKLRKSDPPLDVTAIFCRPRYWQQEVHATIDAITKAPLSINPVGDRQLLAWNAFNTTFFESVLNSGSVGVEVRSDSLPARTIPKYFETVANTNLSMSSGAAMMQPMVGLALGTSTRPLEDYTDYKALAKAYADAYRLLFARAMVDVLGSEVRDPKQTMGEQRITTEAVVLEPVFVHIVVGLLGIVSIAAIALLVLSCRRKRNLRTDPSTIASVMAIVADNEPLLSDFSDLDCCTMEDVQKIIGPKRYKLVNDDAGTSIVEFAHGTVQSNTSQSTSPNAQRRDSPSSIAKPVRPSEFSLWWAIPFVNLFVILAVLLGIVFGKARANGLPLPSSNSIVQNILENYIPTAIATLIEPMWILINRLLCMLQPLEELQDCNAKAKKSIDANYSSLPPQLVVFQALKSRHFVLAAVCTMALLANLLAVAFAGLFNQGTTDIRFSTTFQLPYELRFVPINGSIGPIGGQTFGSLNASGAYQGGNGENQFLIAESNFTRNTPLPAWTDDSMFYLPLFPDRVNITQANSSDFEATTKAFGATLECDQLTLGNNFNAAITIDNSDSSNVMRTEMNISIPTSSGLVRCNSPSIETRPGPIRLARECVTGPSAAEYVVVLNPLKNATQHEIETCMGTVVLGWMHEPGGLCPLGKNISIRKDNSLFVQCRPRFLTGSAKIRVDATGRLRHPATEVALDDSLSNNTGSVFSTDPINLVGQSNRYMFKADDSGFHNDTFAGQFINYFAARASDSSRAIDPTQPVPTFEEVVAPLNKAYTKLFAIWLGTNTRTLFVPAANDSVSPVTGSRVEPQKRLFVSTAMFIISEAILCTYVLVAIWVYTRRPGQYLARLPTSVAAMIALFAASAAVQDMRGTSHLDAKGRRRHLEGIDARYGFGNFIGGDGRVHIGIEKTPFVRKRAKTTWLEQRLPLFRKGSGGG